MVDTSSTMGSEYLTAEAVADIKEPKLQIMTEAKYENTDWGQKLICDVEFQGVKKRWKINNKTNEHLGLKYGIDSIKWINKIIKLRVYEIKGNDTIIGVPE